MIEAAFSPTVRADAKALWSFRSWDMTEFRAVYGTLFRVANTVLVKK